MKISIITVCFNSASTIEETLKSVQTQAYKNIEYIVIDGDSQDHTLDILNNNKEVITHLVSEPDKGLYDAMNKGLALATGDFVGILNSDDTFYNTEVISRVADFLNHHPQIEACTGNIIQHDETGKTKRVYNSKSWRPDKLKIGFMPPHPSIFFKRTLFNQYGEYELDFKIAADYELITRFFLKHKIKWAYSGITTTSMLIGGLSSSGLGSYRLVTQEIFKSLDYNNLRYSKIKVRFRLIWKIMDLLKNNA